MVKIAIIDSGIGGLTVLKDLINLNCAVDFYYISDEENVPYGDKTQNFMYERVCDMLEICHEEGIKHFVLACNTLTAETIDRVRDEYPEDQFFGIEPYINYLNKGTFSPGKKLGLILTPATFASKRFKLLKQLKDPSDIISCYTPSNLALLIEDLKYKHFNEVRPFLEAELEFLRQESLDFLLLGCTHYPIIGKFIEQYLELKTINPHDKIARHIVDSMGLDQSLTSTSSFMYNAKCSRDWKSVKLEDFYFLNQNFV